MDYDDLRKQTLASAQEDEAVTVNTRALIDKVLARYSSENTTLRELLQNAADANAKSVEVQLVTIPGGADPTAYEKPALQDLSRTKVRRLVVKNNGDAFREEDWQRLKRIAEGNPDETKIGAFGVGFYSVFADCEEPFVSSGDQAMAFFWKQNALFTRRAKLDKVDPFTTFLLEYREPTDMPDLKTLCRFFATSLTFVNLEEIKLFIDDRCMLELKKKKSPALQLNIPDTINPRTAEKLMRIAGVESSRIQLDAKYMNATQYKPQSETPQSRVLGFFAKLAAPPVSANKIEISNLDKFTKATIFLQVATGTVATKVGARFAQELERATKKPPPATTNLSILTMSAAEQAASDATDIFENVVPSEAGRIFIGFPTHQTTSIKAHISAPSVIPTVERENIDLNAKTVKTWNIEMLRAAGILSRIVYSDEMAALSMRAKGRDAAGLEQLHGDAIHLMNQFGYGTSTPSSAVGLHMAEAFWTSGKDGSIELLSTQGVLSSSLVRLASDVDFLGGLPLLPARLVKEAPVFVKTLKDGRLLTEITVTDIQHELGEKALTTKQTIAFLKWLAMKVRKEDIDHFACERLLSVTIAMAPLKDPSGQVVNDGIPVPLGEIQNYVSEKRFSADVPVAQTTAPFLLTSRVASEDMDVIGWSPLEVLDWVKYVSENRRRLPVEKRLDESPQFAAEFLRILSKNWEAMTPIGRDSVIKTLQSLTCIPTKQGMRIPKESYFPTVKLFPDLPILIPLQNVKEKALAALGVRKTVDLKLVFDRLMNDSNLKKGGAKWSHVDLINYLTKVQEDIPNEDIKKLKNAAICKAANDTDPNKLYKVSELYVPEAELKKLKLPVLYWPDWRPRTNEAVFLAKLGLQSIPSELTVLKIAANKEDEGLQGAALRYYIAHFHINKYASRFAYAFPTAFLPVQGDRPNEKGSQLALARSCYANPKSMLLGFSVLRPDLQEHAHMFGVQSDPDIRDAVERLIAYPPNNKHEARDKFSYFSTRTRELHDGLKQRLFSSPIIPLPVPGDKSKVRHALPKNVYLTSGADSEYKDIFDFVYFGDGAHAFLMTIGCKPEPSIMDIAGMLANSPERVYAVLSSEEKYLNVLRSIAAKWQNIRQNLALVGALRKSECLAAYKEIAGQGDDEAASIKQFILAKPEDVLVMDDFGSYMIFRDQINLAPQEEALETLYLHLGSSELSRRVATTHEIGRLLQQPVKAELLRKQVVERTRLFLHNNSDKVRHDGDWIEKKLKVTFVRTIKPKRTLKLGGRTSTKTLSSTAAVVLEEGSSKEVLYVTDGLAMYDVAHALCELILQRPKPNNALLLDSLLSTDLLTLKARGYNVDRILRAKQQEAKLMEDQRLKAQEARRKEHEEQERLYQAQQATAARQQRPAIPEQGNAMPGGFEDSSEQAPPNTGGFLSLGFRNFNRLLDGRDGRDSRIRSLADTDSDSASDVGGKSPVPPAQPTGSQPTPPHHITSNLHRAIAASRPHNSSAIFSPPSAHEVRESETFCDTKPLHDIVFSATLSRVRIYLWRTMSDSEKSVYLAQNQRLLMQFAGLLLKITGMMGVRQDAVNVFYGLHSETIAFNQGGSLFFNVKFFTDDQKMASGEGWNAKAVVYWFVTTCHELAHNLASDHGQRHSFYMESFVTEFFEKVMPIVAATRPAAQVQARIDTPTPGEAPPPRYTET